MKLKVAILILILGFLIVSIGILGDKKNPSKLDHSSTYSHPQSAYNYKKSISFLQSLYSSKSQPTLNRDEILKKSLKGYREQTYWGHEHPI